MRRPFNFRLARARLLRPFDFDFSAAPPDVLDAVLAIAPAPTSALAAALSSSAPAALADAEALSEDGKNHVHKLKGRGSKL